MVHVCFLSPPCNQVLTHTLLAVKCKQECCGTAWDFRKVSLKRRILPSSLLSSYCKEGHRTVGGQVGFLDPEDRGHTQAWWNRELEAMSDEYYFFIFQFCKLRLIISALKYFSWSLHASNLCKLRHHCICFRNTLKAILFIVACKEDKAI